MSESGCNLTSVNVEASFGDILDFSLNLWIPFSKIMDSLSNFIKWDVAFLPFWHLEHFKNGQDLPYFLIIFLNIVMRNAEILSDLFVHFTSDSVELNGLRNDATDVCQFIGFFFSHVSALDFCWNSVYAFHNVNHVFKRVFNVILEVLLVRIKVHVLLLDTDVEKTCLSFLFHLIKQESHGLMVDSHQSFDHHEVDKLDEVSESLLVSVGDFK